MLDSSVKEPGAWLRVGGSVGHSSYTHTGEGALESRAMYARLVGDAVKSDFKGLRNRVHVGSSVGQQGACISKPRVLSLGWLKL